MSKKARYAVLLDISSSMSTYVSSGARRIDILREIRDQLPTPPGGCVWIVFGSTATAIDPNMPIPEPQGATAMDMALQLALSYSPEEVAVISDGEPNDAAAALHAARLLNCRISTYFCGEDTDFNAIAFMRELAWCSNDGVGQSTVVPLNKQERLKNELRLLLTGPSS